MVYIILDLSLQLFHLPHFFSYLITEEFIVKHFILAESGN